MSFTAKLALARIWRATGTSALKIVFSSYATLSLMVVSTLGGLAVPANGFGPPVVSAPFSVSMMTDLQYFFSASSCFSLLSTKRPADSLNH